MERILVLGASGRVAAPVARHLRDEGFDVRGAARNASRVLAAVGRGVEAVACDVLDPPLLRRAVEGCQGVLYCVDHPEEDVGMRHLVVAARDAGVRRIVYVSGTTVFEQNAWYPLVARKLRAEAALADGGVDHVVLCPTFFMDVLPEMVRDGRAGVIGKHLPAFHLLAADDFAVVVAGAFRHQKPIHERLFVHGPEPIQLRDALTHYVRAFHPEIRSVGALPIWAALAMGWATRNRQLGEIARMFRYFEKVGEMGDPAGTAALFGAPSTRLDAWIDARRHAVAA